MNYAEDRLDRRARHEKDGLWKDFQEALTEVRHSKSSPPQQRQHHELLGRSLRDIGWVKHAVFHYAMAWMAVGVDGDDETLRQSAAGDYAQMAELSGYPELGLLALLHFRAEGRLKELPSQSLQAVKLDMNWIEQKVAPPGHCGCCFAECGVQPCFVPMLDCHDALSALGSYLDALAFRTQHMPTAHQVHTRLSKGEALYDTSSTWIPPLLQYWRDVSTGFERLNDVLRLLLTKLLYVTVPSLAAEAVAHVKFSHPRRLAQDYKSHWAYFVLVKAVVFGERIKPARRQLLKDDYHVPVWDLLWQKDQRLAVARAVKGLRNTAPSNRCVGGAARCVLTTLEHSIHNHLASTTLPPLARSLPFPQEKPLYVVGDSHIMSLAWQTILLQSIGEQRLAVPVVVTGLKAWHTRPKTRFFTYSLLQQQLRRLLETTAMARPRTILVSAGEIDCREGIGGELLEGGPFVSATHIVATVGEYVKALQVLAREHSFQILVLPVAPHAHRSDKQGKSHGRAVRRQATQLWNAELRRLLQGVSDDGEPRDWKHLFFLDYEADLLDPGYVLKPKFDADSTHMNSAFIPALEGALASCGCDQHML